LYSFDTYIHTYMCIYKYVTQLHLLTDRFWGCQ